MYVTTINVKDFGALGDGSPADSAFADAIQTAGAGDCPARIHVPAGIYELTDLLVDVDNIIFEGDGQSSVIRVGATESRCMSVTADSVAFRQLRFEGDGTADDSTTGRAIYATGGALLMEDVWFTGFGNGPLSMKNLSATQKRGPKLYRVSVRDTAPAAFAEIQIGGGWTDMVFEDMDCVTSEAQRAILISDEDEGLWTDIQVTRGWFEGYSWQGVAISDEAWTGGDRVFGVNIDGGYYKNIGSSAIKVKLAKGVRIANVITDHCGFTPENPNAGLHGAILVNSIGTMDVSHCTLRDCGTAGIVFNGNDGEVSVGSTGPKSWPNGFGLPSIKAAYNFVENAGLSTGGSHYSVGDAPVGATNGTGLMCVGRIKDIDLSHNTVRNAARFGLYVDGVWANSAQSVKLTDNGLFDSPTGVYAIHVKNAVEVEADGNSGHNWSSIVSLYERCETVRIGSRESMGDSAGAGACYAFNLVQNVNFDGRASCSFYPAYANNQPYVEGERVSRGGNVYQAVKVVTPGTSAASGGPSGTDGSVPQSDGSVTWRFVHKYRLNDAGLYFSNSPNLTNIGPNATFDYLVGPPITGTLASNVKRARIASGTATLASGSAAISLPQLEYDNAYKIALTGNAAENFSWSAKSTSGFTINSGNAGSTAKVDWHVYR